MKRLIALLAAALCVLAAFAQTSIKVQAPNLVGVNEQFNITFIISGEHAPSDFQWNPGSDFQLVWGPQKGTSTSVSIVNGKSTRTSQTTYTYVLLPKNTGRFQLAAAEATVKGERLVSSRPTVEVVTDGAAASGQAQGQSQGRQGQAQGGGNAAQTGTVSSDDVFLRLSLSKRNVMVGETVTATLKLYQRVNIAGFEDVKFPAFNGFWSQEVQAPSNIDFHRESIDDKIYNAAVLRSWNLVPQKSGEVTIDPAELVCLVNVRTQRRPTGSIFDDFFQDDYQTIRKRVTTAPVTIHVSALPAGAPASFGGGVGSFKMSASLTRDSLKTHDAASLRVTVTGSGNSTLLEAPKISFPPDFEVYDVKTSDVSGGKVFEYPFIPRSYGDFTIGPVEYSYFDLASHKYVTLQSPALPLRVEKGADLSGTQGGQLVQGVSRKDVRDVGSDIRFISTKPGTLAAAGHFFTGSLAFWITTLMLLVLAFNAWLILRGLAARRSDVVGSKSRGATKMARKRLAQAGVFLKDNLYTAFYEELHRALLGFVSDKLNLDAAEMNKENISARLADSGAGEALAAEFTDLLDACEFARYAPDAGHEAMNTHYEKAVSVISAIDDRMKRSPRKGAGTAAALIALLLLVPAQRGTAQQKAYTDSLWTAGVTAYSEGNWATAEKAWSDLLAIGLESPQLYCNLGDAYFKQDDLAHAILNYERALKLDPSYADARYNLGFAQELVQDKIEAVPDFFLEVWGRKLCWLLPSDTWAVLFLVLLAVTLGCVLLFLLGRSVAARRGGFIAGIVALVLSLLCLSFAFWQRSDYRKADSAIVTRAVTTVQSSPGSDSAKDLFVLHEGTKVRLLDEVGSWRNIELADGRQGWLPDSDLEVI